MRQRGGDVEARYNLGNMYYRGEAISEVYAEALKWYRKSANQGFAKAQGHKKAISSRSILES